LALKLLINSLQNPQGFILRGQILNPGNYRTPPKIEKKLRRKGALGVLFGRHILGLRTQIFLMARVMRMSVTKFLIADPHTAILALTVALFWAGIVFLKN
jgi:membrane protein DedA with SNARE-associated domain